MGYLIFGHGGLTPYGASQMEWCALGPGTSIQFYSDAGQTLMYSNNMALNLMDYAAPEPPITSANVTYNFELTPFDQADVRFYDELRHLMPDHTLLVVGIDLPDIVYLCNGDAQTCPSDPRMIDGTREGPNRHTCGGLLDVYEGCELHWFACTAILFGGEAKDAVDVVNADRLADHVLGGPERIGDVEGSDVIVDHLQSVAIEEGTWWEAGGGYFIIGDEPSTLQYVRPCDDYCWGDTELDEDGTIVLKGLPDRYESTARTLLELAGRRFRVEP